MIRALLLTVFVAWVAGWFWVFSFAYSDSFFEYHLETRLPFLLLALLAVSVPPLSGFAVLKRFLAAKLPAVRARLVHLFVTSLPIALFWAVYAAWVALARGFGRLAFEADEAMGIGIDFAICIGVVAVANVTLWLALSVISVRRKTRAVNT